jgi:hypothetical protein
MLKEIRIVFRKKLSANQIVGTFITMQFRILYFPVCYLNA